MFLNKYHKTAWSQAPHFTSEEKQFLRNERNVLLPFQFNTNIPNSKNQLTHNRQMASDKEKRYTQIELN